MSAFTAQAVGQVVGQAVSSATSLAGSMTAGTTDFMMNLGIAGATAVSEYFVGPNAAAAVHTSLHSARATTTNTMRAGSTTAAVLAGAAAAGATTIAASYAYAAGRSAMSTVAGYVSDWWAGRAPQHRQLLAIEDGHLDLDSHADAVEMTAVRPPPTAPGWVELSSADAVVSPASSAPATPVEPPAMVVPPPPDDIAHASPVSEAGRDAIAEDTEEDAGNTLESPSAADDASNSQQARRRGCVSELYG